MTLLDKLLAYYERNIEDFNNDIEELDGWNDCLYEDKIFSMDELDEVLQGIEPSEILRSALFGHDESQGKIKSTFNLNRDYFHYNGFGNLVSTDKRDYSDYLNDCFVQEIIDNKSHLVLSKGAQEIIDNYENKDDSKGEKGECVTFAFRTSSDVVEKVRRYAFMQNKSIKEVMEEIINEALKDVDLPTRNGGNE